MSASSEVAPLRLRALLEGLSQGMIALATLGIFGTIALSALTQPPGGPTLLIAIGGH
jgi:uncharacterized membrane-anchored protein